MGHKLSFLHHKKFLAVIFIEVVVLCALYKYNFFSFLLDHEVGVALGGPTVPRTVGWNGLFALPLVGPEQMRHYYSEVAANVWCFKQGTAPNHGHSCTCLPSWSGADCGIPAVISSALNHSQAPPVLHRRQRPRRLIYSVIVLSNPELLVLAAEEYAEVVDVYLVGVASHLQTAFQTSGLASLPNIIKILLPFTANRTFPQLQDDLWEVGWHNLTDFRPDDLIIFTEESAIPSKDLLLFLKLHSGFHDPLFTEFHHLQHSFRWQAQDEALINSTAKTMVGSFQFFQQLCSLRPSRIYDDSYHSHSAASAFLKHHGPFSDWVVGTNQVMDYPAGWVCHLCLSPPEPLPSNSTTLPPIVTTIPSENLLVPYEPVSNQSVPYTLYKNNRFGFLLTSR